MSTRIVSRNFRAPLARSLRISLPVRQRTARWVLPISISTVLACTVYSSVLYAEEARGPPVTIDPDTSLAFPNTLRPHSCKRSLELVGLGVRKVSFLRVKVYTAGLYASSDALSALKRMSSWTGYTKEKLATPEGEEMMREMLDLPFDFALRIVPVRPTDGNHLRDGFTRSIVNRTSRRTMPEDEAAALNDALDEFRTIFVRGQVPKGKEMLLICRGSDKALILEYDGYILGEVKNPNVSSEIFLAYFAAKSPISQEVRRSVAQGLERVLA